MASRGQVSTVDPVQERREGLPGTFEATGGLLIEVGGQQRVGGVGVRVEQAVGEQWIGRALGRVVGHTPDVGDQPGGSREEA